MTYPSSISKAVENEGENGMRLIDADALVAKMNLAIAMLKRTMKNFDIEDDPECQMELKAYRDIRDGIKDEPTIEPQRKTGKWMESDTDGFVCSVCRNGYRCQPTLMGKPMFEYCPVCGAKMEG